MTRSSANNLSVLLVLALGACVSGEVTGGDDDDMPPGGASAYLSIVGGQILSVDQGAGTELTVRYHDASNQPLAGTVTFEIVGNAAGGALSSLTGTTDGQGLARVAFNAGQQAAFQVRASADLAAPVAWQLSVVPGEQPAPPLDHAGDYLVESQFDFASGLPGSVGDVVNAFFDMTDGPADPAAWVIDRLLEEIDSDLLTGVVGAFRPSLDYYINDQLWRTAPEFVSSLYEIGNDLGQVARKFGVVSSLNISKLPAPAMGLSATHSMEGFFFAVDGYRYEYSMAELGLGQSLAADVPVSSAMNDTQVLIGEHTLGVSYGRLMLFALDNVVIPAIDPYAHNLEQLLAGAVDCWAVGVDVYDFVGWGTPDQFALGCELGLVATARLIENQILRIDNNGAALKIKGDARPVDANADRRSDSFQGGLWEGELQLGPITSTLARPMQTFVANRR